MSCDNQAVQKTPRSLSQGDVVSQFSRCCLHTTSPTDRNANCLLPSSCLLAHVHRLCSQLSGHLLTGESGRKHVTHSEVVAASVLPFSNNIKRLADFVPAERSKKSLRSATLEMDPCLSCTTTGIYSTEHTGRGCEEC